MKVSAQATLWIGLLGLNGCTLGPTELGIILAIVVLLFGASRLPQLGRALGETLRSFRKASNESDSQAKQIESRETPPDDSSDDPSASS